MKRKVKKEPKPKLLAIYIKDLDKNIIICQFPPTAAGERSANKYKGLAGIEIEKIYT